MQRFDEDIIVVLSVMFLFYSAGSGLHVELKVEKKALLVGETIKVNCVAKGSDLLEQHWKYPGRIVRDKYFNYLS